MRVHEFSSTRDFLRTAFAGSKEHNRSLTVERYARRLGLGSSTLKMILAGRRRLTVHQALTVAKGLRLSSMDMTYLETLALKESSKDSWQKSYYTKALVRKKKEAKLSTIHTAQPELLADPIILPLLVFFLENKTAEIDTAKLAKDLCVSPERISELLDYFKSHQILMDQPDGSYHVAFDKLSHRLVQKKYQKALLADASARLEREYDNPTSFFVSYAFSANEESLLALQQDLKNLMAKYMEEAPSDPSGKLIAQSCFQVFPVIHPQLK